MLKLHIIRKRQLTTFLEKVFKNIYLHTATTVRLKMHVRTSPNRLGRKYCNILLTHESLGLSYL